MGDDKQSIRDEARERLDRYDLADRQRAGVKIATTLEVLLRRFLRRNLVMSYVSQRSEAPTHNVILSRLSRGERVCVPKFHPDSKTFDASELANFSTDLARGYHGILEPRDTAFRPVATREIELHLVPGLAFDPLGGRLGRGMGYYDRFLSEASPDSVKVGMAFSWQLFREKLPMDPHDVPMDLIVTEIGVIPVKEGLIDG